MELQLDSLVATTTDLNMLRHTVHRPEEEAVYYLRHDPTAPTPLNQAMELFGSVPPLSDLLRHAKQAHRQLGPWCSDQIWAFLVQDGEAEKNAARMEREIEAKLGATRSTTWTNLQIQRMREAFEHLKGHLFEEPEFNETHLSPKVMELYIRLESAFRRTPDEKGIVFVRERYTARVLYELFRRSRIPSLRAGILLGSRKAEHADVGVSYRQQMRTMLEFRQGVINCLVSALYRGWKFYRAGI